MAVEENLATAEKMIEREFEGGKVATAREIVSKAGSESLELAIAHVLMKWIKNGRVRITDEGLKMAPNAVRA